MKKFMFIAMILIASTISANNSEYVLDRKVQSGDATTYLGVITRFGYSFADDGFFSYGASIYYSFSSILGITAGFDGYSGKIYVLNDFNEVALYDGAHKSLPMWDVRLGFTLGKYLALGGIYGQCKVCSGDQPVVHTNKYSSQSLTTELTKKGGFFGAFGTVMLPISKNFALNVDLSYTNHTSFTITGGLVIRFKVK